jgi:poly(A) polymerase
MLHTLPYSQPLPAGAASALAIVRTLADAGHRALLAGGCVRDLLRGAQPHDYDVATDARPERVVALFRPTRQVGAQFGVVLVRSKRVWIEVATFRSDHEYHDGRRPVGVSFTDAETDARRRDFTVNGMFLDPLAGHVLDYVGGAADLAARVIRAIGHAPTRFAEDYLRLLRAPRFAARLGYEIEPETLAAIRASAPKLVEVAAERVHDELERMLAAPSRAAGLTLLETTGLLPYLWRGARWSAAELQTGRAVLAALPPEAPFVAAWAALLDGRSIADVHDIGRRLAFSNEDRETVAWLVASAPRLDDPDAPRLSELKRLMAHPALPALRLLVTARYTLQCDGQQRTARLAERLAAVAPEAVAPAPFVTGADLLALRVPEGPLYARVLDELYARQLEETLTSRDDALAALDALLRQPPNAPA